jgi:hypothetical protein
VAVPSSSPFEVQFAELMIINNDNCSERYNQYNIIYVVVVVYLEDIKLFVLERIKKEINAA